MKRFLACVPFVAGLVGGTGLTHPATVSAQQGWADTVPARSVPLNGFPSASRLATNAAGDMLLAWTQAGAVRAARGRTTGVWTESVTLGETTTGAGPSVSIDPAGNAIVAWAGVRSIVAARYLAEEDRWEGPVQIAAAQFPDTPRLGIDASGNATVVWSDSGRITASSRPLVSRAWTVPEDIAVGYQPELAVDPAGNAIVMTYQGIQGVGTAIKAFRFSASTGTWSDGVELATGQSVADRPQVAMDAEGNAMALWAMFPPSASTALVQVTRFLVGEHRWVPVRTLGSTVNFTLGRAELGVGAAGHAVGVWTAPDGVLMASAYDEDTQTWSLPELVTRTGLGQQVWDLAVDTDGRPTAAWVDQAGRVRLASKPGEDGPWVVVDSPSTPGLLSFVPQLAAVGPGVVVAAWGAGSNGCPPECWGAMQSSRWVSQPRAPRITGVTPAFSAVTVHVEAPVTVIPELAPLNYHYSIDDGATWRERSPASVASPLVVDGLSDFSTYRLRIRAVNAAGPGAPSAAVEAMAGPVPAPVVGLTVARVSGSDVTLAWTRSPDGVVPVTRILLEGGTRPGETLTSMTTDGVVSMVTFAAPPGAYYIRARAVSGTHISPPSNEVRVFVSVPVPPSAPAQLLALASDDQLTLSWTNTFDGGAPSSLLLDVIGDLTTTLPLPMGETFTYAGVPRGTYTLRVRAANASGVSAPSNPVTLTFPNTCAGGLPLAPTNLQAWTVGRTIVVSWSPPVSGAAVAQYQVGVRGAYLGAFYTAGRTLSGAALPGTYYISIRGMNACGFGAPTPEQVVVIP